MEIYNIKLVNEENLFSKLFYAIKCLSKEYERKILIGFNAINFSSKKLEELKQNILTSGIKVFLSKNFPPCVFAYTSKYKMCDFSLNLEYKNNAYYLTIFSGSGYPICSYQKKSFLEYFKNFKCENEKGEIFNLKLEYSLDKYIKHIFGNKSKNVKFIKNIYNLFYFKVNDTYYVLNQNFTKIINKENDFIQNKMKKFCYLTYNFSVQDDEFDAYLYMLSRKIPCLLLSDGSILFDSSYYLDYLKIVYYLEFLC